MRTLALLALLALAAPARAQIWVAPRRAGQSMVRYDDLRWQQLDLLRDAEIDGEEAGGVRLLFYDSERETAERAAAHLEETYRHLCEVFHFVPPRRFEYVLYGSYQQFLRTNLFPTQEGLLGVTSTQSLEVALPYFGDHEAFRHTSTHELAHQFTIQKVRALGKDADVLRDPLYALPLWFVEGLAEFVALGPIESDSAMRVRDLVVNPDAYTGYGPLGFWDDWPGYTLWTYQGGHARITFLEEVYGAGTVQRVLDLSPAVVSDQGLAGRIHTFDRLVQEVTGDEPERVAERFDAWVKRRAYAEYLSSGQDVWELVPMERVQGVPLALDTSHDGTLVAYRSIAPDNGRTSLVVSDPRSPFARRRIAADGRPGVESLHPIEPRNFDVEADRLAYVAESRGKEVLVVQHLRHEAEKREGYRPGEPEPGDGQSPVPLKEKPAPGWWKVKLRRAGRERYRLHEAGIVAAGSVAVEPGGERVAVVALGEDGVRDLYLVTPRGGRRFDSRRLTTDVAAERDVAWGPDGLVFNSDASADGRLQLFSLDPDAGGAPVRLTTADRDHREPVVLDDGTVVFRALQDDRSQLFAQVDDQVVQLTDLAIGVQDPAVGADGDLWALLQHKGRPRPVRLPSGQMRTLPGSGTPGAAGPPFELPKLSLEGADRYRAADPRNWGLDGGFAALGAGPGGVYGQLYLSASDKLRDHALIVIAQAYGSPELTDALILYFNQHGRLSYGGGPFHALRFRIDRSLDAPILFQSAERFYGAQASVRYPFDRFVYLQADQAVGGVSYFLFEDDALFLSDGLRNGVGRDLYAEWRELNTFPRFQTETTLRLGIDTTRYHPKTGPVAGLGLLVDGTLGVQPFDGEIYGSLRFDGQQYVPVPFVSGGNLGFKASAGTSGLGRYAQGYWLSSYDTLRAYLWGDPELLGRHYWFGNAELQLPLDALVRLAVASSVEAVAGLDFGAVADDPTELWDRRVLDGALGTNFVLGPLVLRLHFARAIDIGAPLPETPTPWVTNFSISWLGL